MTGPERAADELLVAAVERPAVLELVAEQAAAELGPAAGEALAALAGTCAAVVEELAELRGLDVGKLLDELLDGCPAGSVVDGASEQGAVERILELRAEGRPFRVIAQTLTAEGYYRRANWGIGAVTEVVRREVARAGS